MPPSSEQLVKYSTTPPSFSIFLNRGSNNWIERDDNNGLKWSEKIRSSASIVKIWYYIAFDQYSRLELSAIILETLRIRLPCVHNSSTFLRSVLPLLTSVSRYPVFPAICLDLVVSKSIKSSHLPA